MLKLFIDQQGLFINQCILCHIAPQLMKRYFKIILKIDIKTQGIDKILLKKTKYGGF